MTRTELLCLLVVDHLMQAMQAMIDLRGAGPQRRNGACQQGRQRHQQQQDSGAGAAQRGNQRRQGPLPAGAGQRGPVGQHRHRHQRVGPRRDGPVLEFRTVRRIAGETVTEATVNF